MTVIQVSWYMCVIPALRMIGQHGLELGSVSNKKRVPVWMLIQLTKQGCEL